MSVPPIQSGYPVAGTVVDDELGDPLPRKSEVKEFSEDSGPEDAYEGFGETPFADGAVAEHWRQVYAESQYECRHVFDPTLTWSEEEEKAIIRKLDWRVCLWACVMFFGLQVDRGNLVQAVSDNMLGDLGLNTNDYNYGNTVFLISFLVAELPSQLLSKKIGPDRWIPTQICLWSIVASSQFFISGNASFLVTRALLGVLEGGFIPDLVLWLSYFYTSRELPIRLSYFWTTLSVTSILTSLLAFALLHMRGVLGYAGWRWLFLIEGLITLIVGIASFFLMPASAVQTKTWFRPNGWFSDREVAIVVNRVLRDDPSKGKNPISVLWKPPVDYFASNISSGNAGDMHNRQALTPRRLWQTLRDYDLWPLYILGLVIFIPQSPPTKYLTLIVKSLGFSTFNTNLLTIPSSVLHIITLLAITRLSEFFNERTLVAMLQAVWTLPCVIALEWWPGMIDNKWGTYALVTILLSYPYCHAILVAWTSKNSNNVGTRSVSAALYNMSVQLGNIIGNFIYRDDDKPYYRRGNRNLFIINLLAIVLFLLTKVYYIWRNKQKERVWNALSKEEQDTYIRNTRLQGSRRLDFKFAH